MIGYSGADTDFRGVLDCLNIPFCSVSSKSERTPVVNTGKSDGIKASLSPDMTMVHKLLPQEWPYRMSHLCEDATNHLRFEIVVRYCLVFM